MNATIRRNPTVKYFVSILAEEEVQPLDKTGSAIGIDLGITDFSILSNGQKIDNHKFTLKMEKKLKREQRKLSRRALIAIENNIALLDAKNYQKQRRKVARLHEKVMNQRENYLNKLSTDIGTQAKFATSWGCAKCSLQRRALWQRLRDQHPVSLITTM